VHDRSEAALAIESEREATLQSMRSDVRRGLSLEQKELDPKYFYDERGSELFEEICTLPEYYQTRTERSILEAIMPDLVAEHAPSTLIEFGSGSSVKTRLILSEMARRGVLRRYVPIDISREILISTAESLVREYPGLAVDAVIGDFNDGLPSIDAEGRALIIFLGSTIGNFRRDEAIPFLRRVADGMRAEDLFLLGVDLVKEPARLNAAYDDAAGITAAFNLNVLRVINRELGGRFDLERFSHYAFYNPRASQIEMHLASLADQSVAIDALGMTVNFTRGETILTEISRKFTHASVARLLEESGLERIGYYTDPEGLFALTLSRRAS
jgi:L-histidine N-alpha-methyltransferase